LAIVPMRCSRRKPATTVIFAYLHVDDVDALYTEFVQRGAIVRQPPTDRLWGMREMAVATPDGHRMMIGQKI
jgi:uncharacterized glyoxalase superfamily protein PhnB